MSGAAGSCWSTRAGKFTFAELEENEEDLAKLEAWLRKVEVRDRFGAPSASEARAAVLACREDLEAFAASVYEAADHGSAGRSMRANIFRSPPLSTTATFMG
jgi:hypothetical protein